MPVTIAAGSTPIYKHMISSQDKFSLLDLTAVHFSQVIPKTKSVSFHHVLKLINRQHQPGRLAGRVVGSSLSSHSVRSKMGILGPQVGALGR